MHQRGTLAFARLKGRAMWISDSPTISAALYRAANVVNSTKYRTKPPEIGVVAARGLADVDFSCYYLLLSVGSTQDRTDLNYS